MAAALLQMSSLKMYGYKISAYCNKFTNVLVIIYIFYF